MRRRLILCLISLLLILSGLMIGRYILFTYNHCLEIHARKDVFYGKLAKELKEKMQKLGYSFTCPAVLPKTVIDFTYTGKQYYQNRYQKSEKDTTVALVGDCFKIFDLDFLKTYDYLLVVTEEKFGYMAMFNFKALHFPIVEPPYHKLCGLSYESQDVKIEDVAQQLDDIIQRIRHDKK